MTCHGLYSAVVHLIIYPAGRPGVLQNKSWKEALLAAVIIAVSMVYGLDYLRNGMNLPHPGHLFERLMPLVDAYNAFFKLPT